MSEGDTLHELTLDTILGGRLGTQRVGQAIRIVAGQSEKYPNGIIYWGFSAMQAREIASDLIELANEIHPIRRLC